MTIQEFSRQLGREEHPSQLIRALQTLRDLDRDQPRWAGEWIPWGEDLDTDQIPRAAGLVSLAGFRAEHLRRAA